MRRVAIATVFCLLAGLFAGRAEACIKFDRDAEMAIIDEAIAAPKTPEWDKTVLRALRKEIVFFRDKNSWTSEDVLQIHWLTTAALKSLGRERIVWTEPDSTETAQVTKGGPVPPGAARGCG